MNAELRHFNEFRENALLVLENVGRDVKLSFFL